MFYIIPLFLSLFSNFSSLSFSYFPLVYHSFFSNPHYLPPPFFPVFTKKLSTLYPFLLGIFCYFCNSLINFLYLLFFSNPNLFPSIFQNIFFVFHSSYFTSEVTIFFSCDFTLLAHFFIFMYTLIFTYL